MRFQRQEGPLYEVKAFFSKHPAMAGLGIFAFLSWTVIVRELSAIKSCEIVLPTQPEVTSDVFSEPTTTRQQRVRTKKAAPAAVKFEPCTQEQKSITLRQTNVTSSIKKLTKCPNQENWLEEYYLQDRPLKGKERWLAINIGCNKGFDSLNLLRMGTKDQTIRQSSRKIG